MRKVLCAGTRGKTPGLGNFVDPMDLITKFSAEAFRYYFMRECPFPGDGDFSWQRFEEVYNADLANNLGNLYSRVVRLIAANYEGHLQGTARVEPLTPVYKLSFQIREFWPRSRNVAARWSPPAGDCSLREPRRHRDAAECGSFSRERRNSSRRKPKTLGIGC